MDVMLYDRNDVTHQSLPLTCNFLLTHDDIVSRTNPRATGPAKSPDMPLSAKQAARCLINVVLFQCWNFGNEAFMCVRG